MSSERGHVDVSVIIPLQPPADAVADAVRSVLAQTYRPIEVIVVDCGDANAARVALGGIDDPRLQLLRVVGGGRAAALNRGLQAARGAYLAFLEPNGRWRPDKLALQMAVLTAEPEVDLMFCDGESLLRRRRRRGLFDGSRGLRRLPTRSARGGLGRVLTVDTCKSLGRLPGIATPLSTVVLRQRTVADLRFAPGGPYWQDLRYLLQAFMRARAGFVPLPLVRLEMPKRRPHPESPVQTVQGLREMLACNPPRQYHAILRRRLGQATLDWAAQLRQDGDYAEAAAQLRQCLRLPGVQLPGLARLAGLSLTRLLRRSGRGRYETAEKP